MSNPFATKQAPAPAKQPMPEEWYQGIRKGISKFLAVERAQTNERFDRLEKALVEIGGDKIAAQLSDFQEVDK